MTNNEIGAGVTFLAFGILLVFVCVGLYNGAVGTGPGHVTCANGVFDGDVRTAYPPSGTKYARDYSWRLHTATGNVIVTGECVFTPAAEHP